MTDEKKFYRLADGRLVTVRIEVDDDQTPHNPRENESNGSVIVTWESDYISPDKAADLPGELDEAVSRWTDRRGVSADRFARYARIYQSDSVLYIGAVSRSGYNGAMTVDDNPMPGEHHDGIVVVTRDTYASVNGDAVPTPESARELARWEVARYSAWATGDVYGYVVEDSDGNEIDSCWGYIGSDEFAYMYQQAVSATGETAEEVSEAEYDDAVVSA